MSELDYNEIAEILGATVTEVEMPVFGGFSANRTAMEHLRTIHDTHRRIRLSEKEVKLIARAFEETREGYEVDRLLVSNELSKAFLNRCYKLGVRACPSVVFKKLQGIRKANSHGIILKPATRDSGIDPEPVSYIAEIAYSQLPYHPELSEDEVITNPDIGREFEHLARLIDPKASLTSVKWALISLRKSRGAIKVKSEKLLALQPSVMEKRLESGGTLENIPVAQIPEEEGVFTIHEHAGNGRYLYVASASNLRAAVLPFRGARPFAAVPNPFWHPEPRLMDLRYSRVKRKRDEPTARDWYFRLVQAWQPLFNMPVELTAKAAA